MNIYILRHGKAEERAVGGHGDTGRRLTESGRREMQDISLGLWALGITPARVISSPLARAKETAHIILRHLSRPDSDLAVWPELKPESDILSTHQRLAAMAPDDTVMLVGHEPHLSVLISSMIAVTPGSVSLFNLKKGGLAMIRGHAQKGQVRGHLRYLLTPRQIRMCSRHAQKHT